MRRFRILLAAFLCSCLVSPAFAVRIKDICSIEGVRSNHLIGYGLVGGLDNVGDKVNTVFTVQSLAAYLRLNNIELDVNDVQVKNVAAVVVTAELPPFARQGMRIDVRVSSIGDARNLHGGTLFATVLRPMGASPTTPNSDYAVAQGALSTGGFAAASGGGGARASVVKNHPTTALIPNGAIVERTVQTAFATKPEIVLQLRNPDFTTAQRIANIINHTFGSQVAQARDSGAVAVKMPAVGGTGERVKFIAQVEELQVSPDSPAKVVYNERTGTIVMGGKVRISSAIISHGNLHISLKEADTTVLDKTVTPVLVDTTQITASEAEVTVEEDPGEFRVLEEGVTIEEVAEALNALGVTSRDTIAILQALKQCGALQAELVAM